MAALSALWDAALAAVAAASLTERVAAALGFLYVLLVIRQQRAGWLAALASTLMYLPVFAASHLYMQAALQVYYVGVALYGWWAWRGTAGAPALAVTRAGWRLQLAGAALALAATGLSVAWLERGGLSPAPLLDSLTTWASVFATWLQARKRLENWLWWIAIDALIAALCWQQQLYPSMILYILYLGLAAIGWRSWWRDMRATTVGGVGA